MLNKAFMVTLASNIGEDGNLVDENIIGMAVSDHMIPIVQQDRDGNAIQGVAVRVGVLWDHKKVPSPCYEAPEDLYCLNIVDDDAQDADDDDDTDIEEGEVVEED